MDHGVGIDTGEAMLVRGGVHGDNDIISIGKAPNVAAKLSEVRGGKSINISSTVYNNCHQSVKVWTDGRAMWEKMGSRSFGGKSVTYYGSGWWVAP
jgi:uridylate cyclase